MSSILYVEDIKSLLTEQFNSSVNCIVAERKFPNANFDKLASHFWKWARGTYPVSDPSKIVTKGDMVVHGRYGYRPISFQPIKDFLRNTPALSEGVVNAAEILKADFQFLEDNALRSEIRFITDCDIPQARDKISEFHIDHMGWEFGRIVGCYNNPTTEWVENHDAEVDKNFNVKLKPGAEIHSFPPGSIWRTTTRFTPDAPPFIHRAPSSEMPRILILAHRIDQEVRTVKSFYEGARPS